MQMWRNPVLAAAAIAATLVTAATVSVAQEENAGVIQYRKAVMSGMGGHMGAISRIVRGEVDFADHLAAHAQALNDLANMIPDAFAEQGSGADTRSLPLVWEDHEGFLAAAEELKTATAAFAAAAETGDMDAVTAAFGPVGAACQSCHQTYRAQ